MKEERPRHSKLLIRCAWCGKPMGEKNGLGQEGTSHGICDECEAKVKAGTWKPRLNEKKEGGKSK